MSATVRTGARWWRVALQVNPATYNGEYRGQATTLNEATYVRAVLSKAKELGIEALAITDHHSVDGIAAFVSSAPEFGVTVFPGFELTSSEGVHLLCIFEPGRPPDELKLVLGDLGVKSSLSGARPVADGCIELMRRVSEIHRGVVIAAHALNDNGLLSVLSGEPRANAWKSPHLNAAQIPGADTRGLDLNYRQILTNRDPAYKREPARGVNRGLALVLARDVASPEDLANEAASCWIKMGAPTLDGLRLAFLDPDDRVSLVEPATPDWPRIAGIRWTGGFLDGQEVQFGPQLNVLIGGRGAGKSTVVESIRFVLGQQPRGGKEYVERHQSLVRKALGPGGTVEIVVVSAGLHPTWYTLRRVVGKPTEILGDDGAALNLEPSAVLRGLELFGQRELSAIAREPTDQVHLLDRYRDNSIATTRRQEDLRHQLTQSRAHLETAERLLAKVETEFSERPTLEEDKKRLEKSGLSDRLTARRTLAREQTLVRAGQDRVAQVAATLDLLAQAVPIDRTFVSRDAMAGLPNRDSLSGIDPALEALEVALTSALSDARRAVADAAARITAVEALCAEPWQRVEQEYQATLRTLERESFDGTELIRLEQKLAELRAGEPRLNAARSAVTERKAARAALLIERHQLAADVEADLRRAAKKVKKKLKGLVEASVDHSPSRKELERTIRGHVPGQLEKLMRCLRDESGFGHAALADLCREGPSRVATALGCTENQAAAICGAGEPLFRDLEELDEPPEARIRLNVASAGQPPHFLRLDDLSDGQKATALLLIVLGESTAPLVIDQPEDDLDNRFIVEGVVTRLREAKRGRQVIVATHNANVPVLGDCELLVPLVGAVSEGVPRGRVDEEAVGSIDDADARRRVEELLEGGRRAFETRRERYGY